MKHLLLAVTTLLMCTSSSSVAGDISGKVHAKGVKHSGDAVIYVAKIEGKTFPVPKEHPTMDQKNLVFVPHVLAVLVGTTVDFVNSDEVLHNVFSPEECAEKFNLGSWPKGQVRSYTFKRPGCTATLLCNVHPEMEAYVFVAETPYYAVSAKDGSYTIKNVPEGSYTLKVWHEKLKGETQQVKVPASGQAVVNFDLKK